MSDFTIERVFVHPISGRGLLRGFARIQIEGGLFISELRIYADPKEETKLYIAFPTRKNGERKVVYPVVNEARIRITEAITKQYLKELENGNI